MKKIIYLLVILFGVSLNTVKAQQRHGTPVAQGSVSEFLEKFGGSNKRLKQSSELQNEVQLNLDGIKSVTIALGNTQKTKYGNVYSGKVKNANALFTLRSSSDEKIEGSVVFKETKEAYRIFSDSKNQTYVQAVDINQIICSEYPKAALQASVASAAVLPSDVSLYNLQSYPVATAVVLLDFDGEYVPAGNWGNAIYALPADMTDDERYEAWSMISEDFRPFNINITTDEAVYQHAPANLRMRAIFTPTDDALPGYGGVAFLSSFTWGNNTPCWVINGGGKAGGETGSHEIGHTLGLSHDNWNNGTTYEEYYEGHGNWGPIMGSGVYRDVVQWSKGEYQYAANHEDDVAIIASASNGFGYRPDLVQNFNYGPYTPTPLIINASGVIDPTLNNGVIETAPDGDAFSFSTSGGDISINVMPAAIHPDLDIQIVLRYSYQIINIADTGNGLPATLNANLSPGTYTIEVKGVGSGDPLLTGYSDYGSLGYYAISGTIPGGNLRSPENPSGTVNGLNYSYYQGTWNSLPSFSALAPVKSGTISICDLSPKTSSVNYGFKYSGYISVPVDGQYTFYTSSDDGSKLYIGSNVVVDNDGLHDFQEHSGSIGLKAGKHAIKVEYFQNDGGDNLSVSYAGPGISKQTISSLVFFRPGTANPGEFVGYYKLVSKRSGKVIEVPGGDLSNGAFIDQLSYAGSDYQKWLLESLGEGNYKISAKHSKKSLDVFGNELSDGAAIKQWDYESFDNQKWSIVSVGSGYYKIVAKHSGKALEVANSSTANGALIVQRTYSGTDNQKWQVVSLGLAGREETMDEEIVDHDNETLSIYPNPAESKITVSHYAFGEGITVVQILNDFSYAQLTKEFKVQKGINNLELDISQVKSGLYIIKVMDGNSIRFKKIIVK